MISLKLIIVENDKIYISYIWNLPFLRTGLKETYLYVDCVRTRSFVAYKRDSTLDEDKVV